MESAISDQVECSHSPKHLDQSDHLELKSPKEEPKDSWSMGAKLAIEQSVDDSGSEILVKEEEEQVGSDEAGLVKNPEEIPESNEEDDKEKIVKMKVTFAQDLKTREVKKSAEAQNDGVNRALFQSPLKAQAVQKAKISKRAAKSESVVEYDIPAKRQRKPSTKLDSAIYHCQNIAKKDHRN